MNIGDGWISGVGRCILYCDAIGFRIWAGALSLSQRWWEGKFYDRILSCVMDDDSSGSGLEAVDGAMIMYLFKVDMTAPSLSADNKSI